MPPKNQVFVSSRQSAYVACVKARVKPTFKVILSNLLLEITPAGTLSLTGKVLPASLWSIAMSQSTAQEIETISSAVNESNFIQHLRLMFSTKDTVLSETMQNARRAGATSVSYDFNEETKTLVIIDNGCGINDFKALITVAESSWSAEIMDSDQPFGIGFSSVSFSAETVLVESRAKMVEFSSEDLINKVCIPVKTSSFIGGTRLTLSGFKLDANRIGNALKRFAHGFSIPVFWMGKQLPRPHAAEFLPMQTTPIGQVYIPGIHVQEKKGFYNARTDFYCQGLPISSSCFRSHHYQDQNIVHVDHLMFKPRMPDRECFVDASEADVAFDAAIKDCWRGHLNYEKSVMTAKEFVQTYWHAANKAGFSEVFNDVPLIPANTLTYISETPVRSDHYSFHTTNKSDVTKEQVESGQVVLCGDIDYDDSGDGFSKLMFAEKLGYRFFLDSLHESHWAQPFIKNLNDEKAVISGKVIAKDFFSGSFVSSPVRLFETLSVTIAGETAQITEPVVVGTCYCDNVAFLVPKSATYAGSLLRQASSYIDEDDHFSRTDLDLDDDALTDLLAIMRGEDCIKTLEKCLSLSGTGSKSNLRNTAFVVTFDAQGKASVIKAS